MVNAFHFKCPREEMARFQRLAAKMELSASAYLRLLVRNALQSAEGNDHLHFPGITPRPEQAPPQAA